MLSVNVVSANAASPRGAGSAMRLTVLEVSTGALVVVSRDMRGSFARVTCFRETRTAPRC